MKLIGVAQTGNGYMFNSFQLDGTEAISINIDASTQLSDWDIGLKNLIDVPYYHPATSQITQVIYSPPATIVLWDDNTKTIVKCQPGEEYDWEKGLAMAIIKKRWGNIGSYHSIFKDWEPKEPIAPSKHRRTRLIDTLENVQTTGAFAILNESNAD